MLVSFYDDPCELSVLFTKYLPAYCHGIIILYLITYSTVETVYWKAGDETGTGLTGQSGVKLKTKIKITETRILKRFEARMEKRVNNVTGKNNICV